MLKKILSQQSGLTLIEVLATLVISVIFIGITFSVLTTTVTFNVKTNSHIDLRQEANIIITQMREKHQEGEEIYSLYMDDLLSSNLMFEELELNHIDEMLISCTGIRNCEDINVIEGLNPLKTLNVNFTLSNQEYSFDLNTAIENKKFAQQSINIDVNVPSPPGEEDSFESYIREQNVFIYGNNLQVTGSSTVTGVDATVVVQEGFDPGNASTTYIQAKNIYISGNVNMNNFALGNPIGPNIPISTVYIDGDVSITGGSNTRPRILGHLKYTGMLDIIHYLGDSIITHTRERVTNIEFPERHFPNFRPNEWYVENEYQSSPTIRNNMKFIGSNLTFADWGSETFSNVVIASTGNVNLNGNVHVSGIIFAPNGEVNINGSSTFRGVIISDKTSVTGNSHVYFEPIDENLNLPFE